MSYVWLMSNERAIIERTMGNNIDIVTLTRQTGAEDNLHNTTFELWDSHADMPT